MNRLLCILACALPAPAQDPLSPGEAILKNEPAIKSVEGVIEISVGGVNREKLIVIRVATDRARDVLRDRFGERIEGYRVIILVAPAPPPKIDAPALSAGQTVPAPEEKPKASAAGEEECDLIREALKQPPRKTKHSDSQRCVWMRRTVYGGADGRDPYALVRKAATPGGATPWREGSFGMASTWSCEYAKHRDDCPVAMQLRKDVVAKGLPPAPNPPMILGPSGPEPVPQPPSRRSPYGGYGSSYWPLPASLWYRPGGLRFGR